MIHPSQDPSTAQAAEKSDADFDGLFDNNRAWSAAQLGSDPEYFRRLAKQQSPQYFWIGCSDSRVPANQILGLAPGEVFVHRNVANLVVHSDLNCLTVVQFAVDVFKVRHIMVVGHYGCGGVHASLQRLRVGLADNWLRHVEDTRQRHEAWFDRISDPTLRFNRLCELNVIEQTVNLCRTTVVLDAWARGQPLTIHGLVYGLHDGRLRRIGRPFTATDDIDACYQQAIEQIRTTRTKAAPVFVGPAEAAEMEQAANGDEDDPLNQTRLGPLANRC